MGHIERPSLARRRMTPAEAQLTNRLSRRATPMALRAEGAQLAAAVIGPIPVVDGAPWLHLTVNGHAVAAQVAWGNLRRVAGVPVETLPAEDAALLVEDALAPWLDEIEMATGLSLRFVAVSTDPPTHPLVRGWGVQGQSAARSVVRQAGALRLVPGAAMVLADALVPLTAERGDLVGLLLRVELEIDGAVLRLDDLRSLQPGDALVIDDRDDEARLVAENQLVASAAPDAGGWRLLGPFRARSPFPRMHHRKGPEMTDEPTPAMPSPAAAVPTADRSAMRRTDMGADPGSADLIDALEVRLSFRLGETLVTLAELRTLGMGAVVTLDRPDGALVDILANGRRIGTGEVIAVGGQRAVEIRSLFADG